MLLTAETDERSSRVAAVMTIVDWCRMYRPCVWRPPPLSLCRSLPFSSVSPPPSSSRLLSWPQRPGSPPDNTDSSRVGHNTRKHFKAGGWSEDGLVTSYPRHAGGVHSLQCQLISHLLNLFEEVVAHRELLVRCPIRGLPSLDSLDGQ